MINDDDITGKISSLHELAVAYEEFVVERDWDKFHNPKNLAAGLSIEASEVLEIFQWMSAEESECLSAPKLDSLSDELADVLLYLVRLAGKYDIDLLSAADSKLQKNITKYPAALVKGSAKKYTEY
jgi:NTP pyrophosphatase (non-canonical NTP hydrolase)